LRAAWAEGSWQENVTLVLDSGKFVALENTDASHTKNAPFSDILLPGFVNAHSHAFHRFFAGDGEYRNPDQKDDFWSWRTAMYKQAQSLCPKSYEQKAGVFFKELVANGITHLVEFHYIHHKPDGGSYEPETKMSEALLRAAKDAGLRLCLLATYYNKGGFERGIARKQKRFYSKDVKAFGEFSGAVQKLCSEYGQDFGYALHSVRAVGAEDIKDFFHTLDPKTPVHIHVSEQTKEVEDCQNLFGKTPIELVLDRLPPGDKPCNLFLVHATHASPKELEMISRNHASVIVCPTTEANLGDGIFPWEHSDQNSLQLGFGTDANLSVSMWEEFRQFEYAQRLTKQRRGCVAPSNYNSVADYMFESCWRTGIKNFRQHGYLQPGIPFTGVLADGSCPDLTGCKLENVLSRLTFRSQSKAWVKQVWTHGVQRRI
jgi:formimidoylglutamate deiminase